jgi:AcrR family transcriptional regulator
VSVKRQRLRSHDSRARAIEAARQLLIEGGPAAVTLKAVATLLGQSHANLLHHFGSAAGLQTALIEAMAQDITTRIGAAVLSVRRGEEDHAHIVDLAFDAFQAEGAGSLATWMILNRDTAALAPLLRAVHNLVHRLADGVPAETVARSTLALTLIALGDSLLGEPMAETLGLPRESARELALQQLLLLAHIPGQAGQEG